MIDPRAGDPLTVPEGTWWTTSPVTAEQADEDRPFLAAAMTTTVTTPAGRTWTWTPYGYKRRAPAVPERPRAPRWPLILAIVVVIVAVFVVQIAASRREPGPASAAPTLSGTLPEHRDSSLARAAGRPRSETRFESVGSVPPLPDTATSVVGIASWFCHPPKYPRCTRGVPASSYAAAAGPALRVGDWRGRIVKVCAVGGRCVRVRLSDWCACPRRVVDLYHSAFAAIASPSRGVVRVEVTWGASTRVVLPPTDTALHGESDE